MDENLAPASHAEATPKRCADCGLEYFPHIRRGDSDDRVDKLFGFDVVSVLNTVMDMAHASHDRPGTSDGAFAAWNWLAGLRQMFGPEQSSAREWTRQIAALRLELLEFAKAATRQESLETVLAAHGGQSPVVRTRTALQLARELAAELSSLEHIWKKPSKARRPSKHILGMLELRLHKVGFSQREIAIANFDGSLAQADTATEAGERKLNGAAERVKKRISLAEKHTRIDPETGKLLNGGE